MTRQQETELSTADLAGREPAVDAGQDTGATQALDLTDTAPEPEERSTDPEVRLLDPMAGEAFQQRWTDTQTRFVDDPRGAVKEADTLVADVMRSLAAGFADHKSSLEEQWSQDNEPDTEQLRLALQRYRVFFSRLLST